MEATSEVSSLPETPDFDCYPVRFQALAARTLPRGVAVRWSDGRESRHHVFWLRENAPDPATTHPVTREQALQLVDLPEDLEAVWAGIGTAGELRVRWSSGEESRFHPGWLRAHAAEFDEGFGDLPPARLWDGSLAAELPRFRAERVLDEGPDFGPWLEALHVFGVALVEGLPKQPETIERVIGQIGPIRETNFGRIFDVRVTQGATSNAYTAMTLPLHTDLSTREYMPGLQFLHCLENGCEGGDSLLADGFRITKQLEALTPAHFRALTELPLALANKARDSDYRFESPMIVLAADGSIAEVRWNPWLRAPLRLGIEDTDLVYRALREVFALAESPENRIRVRLRPGDLLGFDNRRVLHGRTGYDPRSGSRWLRGCYLERDELLSRLRIVWRRQRERDGRGARPHTPARTA